MAALLAAMALLPLLPLLDSTARSGLWALSRYGIENAKSRNSYFLPQPRLPYAT